MAKTIQEWIESDVRPLRALPVSELSQTVFFRDPARPSYSDPSLFFSPADGIILYQKYVQPDEAIVDIKGIPYSLQDALRDRDYSHESIVIGIFMTFYDVHINRIPYSGRLSYRILDPIDTHNHPMLDIEKSLLDAMRADLRAASYLRNNQRIVNRVQTSEFEYPYYILQVADYDVDCITPFELKQNQPCFQGQRFSQIRYGSQVDLIVPMSSGRQFLPMQRTWMHVEGGIDPLIRIVKQSPRKKSQRKGGNGNGKTPDR